MMIVKAITNQAKEANLMCLSTVYRNEKQEENILCRFVSSITAEGDTLTFTDIMGETVTVTGRLVCADLTAGTVVVAVN